MKTALAKILSPVLFLALVLFASGADCFLGGFKETRLACLALLFVSVVLLVVNECRKGFARDEIQRFLSPFVFWILALAGISVYKESLPPIALIGLPVLAAVLFAAIKSTGVKRDSVRCACAVLTMAMLIVWHYLGDRLDMECPLELVVSMLGFAGMFFFCFANAWGARGVRPDWYRMVFFGVLSAGVFWSAYELYPEITLTALFTLCAYAILARWPYSRVQSVLAALATGALIAVPMVRDVLVSDLEYFLNDVFCIVDWVRREYSVTMALGYGYDSFLLRPECLSVAQTGGMLLLVAALLTVFKLLRLGNGNVVLRWLTINILALGFSGNLSMASGSLAASFLSLAILLKATQASAHENPVQVLWQLRERPAFLSWPILGRGSERVTFLNPDNPDRCLKVSVFGHASQTLREARNHRLLTRLDATLDAMPAIYGCTRGRGYYAIEEECFAAAPVGTYDSVMPLTQALQQADRATRTRLRSLYDRFYHEMIDKRVMVVDLHSDNILVATRGELTRLVVIDGLGYPWHWILISRLFPMFAHSRIRAQDAKFQKRLREKGIIF